MTLVDAYQKLGLTPPVEFEQAVLSASPGLMRGVGTTTRMLVMAALDLCEDTHVTVLMATKQSSRTTRATLLKYATEFGVTSKQVRNLEVAIIAGAKASTNPTAVTYVDHWRDPLDGDDRRVLGPLGLARWADAHATRPGYTIVDRDDNVLGEVTSDGLKALRHRHFVEVVPAAGLR